MNLELKLIHENVKSEIHYLNDFICEYNIQGMRSKVKTKESRSGTMGAIDFLPVIQILLGSTVVASGVKGMFDIIKNYFDLKKQEVASLAEIEKSKIEQHKIEFTFKDDKGKKANIKFASFDDKERERFFKIIDDFFNR